jgi:hypothetical protein
LDAGWVSSEDEDQARDPHQEERHLPDFTAADDVSSAGSLVSLRCPLSYMKMEVPARGPLCEHDAAFDLATYIAQGVATSTWNCPVCNAGVLWNEAVVCTRLRLILQEGLRGVDINDCDSVWVGVDGRWSRLGAGDAARHNALRGSASSPSAALESPAAARKRARGSDGDAHSPARGPDAAAVVFDVDNDEE